MTDNFRVRRFGSGPLADCFELLLPYAAEDARHCLREFYVHYPNFHRLSDMLIYGQKPSSPPPATLTQEQLARDAGQLVEAHALLDKLCDDTDRSQHSLVHRLKQILLGSEAMARVLEGCGFNPAADGLLDCVRALAGQHDHFKDHLGEADKRNLGYQLEITRQGQRLEHCRAHLTQACRTFGVPNPANMIVEGMAMAVNERATGWGALHADAHRMFDKAGIPNGTLDERVRVAIERGQQPKVSPDAAHCVKIVEECTRKLTQADVPTGNLLDRIQLLINDRAALLQSKTSYGVSPTLDEKAWEVRNRDNRVMAVCTSLADAQRIRASLEAR